MAARSPASSPNSWWRANTRVKGEHGLIVTRDMHERKRKMFELADAFVALPGGVGTLEEIVEQMTWAQLGRHKKPILLANIEGFWQPLCALLDHMKTLEFIRGDLNFDLLVADKVDDILPMLQQGGGGSAGRRQDDDARRTPTSFSAICATNVTASMRLPSGSRMKAA